MRVLFESIELDDLYEFIYVNNYDPIRKQASDFTLEHFKENKLNLEEKLIKTLENVNQQIDKHEQIEKIIIMKDAWTTENNILTPTMKIKRSKLDSMYEKEYPKWYEMSQKVIWQ